MGYSNYYCTCILVRPCKVESLGGGGGLTQALKKLCQNMDFFKNTSDPSHFFKATFCSYKKIQDNPGSRIYILYMLAQSVVPVSAVIQVSYHAYYPALVEPYRSQMKAVNLPICFISQAMHPGMKKIFTYLVAMKPFVISN